MDEPRSILVRGPNWLGDVVMATPGFRALREGFPSARIALHLRRDLVPLLDGAPWFDEVLPLAPYRGRPGALLAEGMRLRRRRFDLGICLPDSFSAALLMRIAGVRRIVGYHRNARAPLLHVAVPLPDAGGSGAAAGRPMIPRERHVLELVEAAGAPSRGTGLELFVSAGDAEAAEAELAKRGLEPDRPLAVLAPGASYGPSKLWPAERFARVGDALASEGVGVVLAGAPSERGLSRRVAEAMRAPAIDLTGAVGLGALKAVVRRAQVVVCNDAGVRHVAAAFGVPAVVLMGPTSLEKTALNLERVQVLTADVGCRPCYHRVCPIDHRCMTRIGPERVVEAARAALEPEVGPRRGAGGEDGRGMEGRL